MLAVLDRTGSLDPPPDGLPGLYTRTAVYLVEHGQPGQAIALLHRALPLAEHLLGPDHPDTLASRHNLAGAYGSAGRVEEAVRLHEETLADALRVLDADHPLVAKIKENLTIARNPTKSDTNTT
ncbi:tetratricopeptide repeat protein [Protofrankia sp. BMG5.30]|uniref:tetratricopeptide repeat protein n=1 Tax=Protofrankia sp. BMG5.30 TaxID=1834514 RepID=UPI00352AA31B